MRTRKEMIHGLALDSPEVSEYANRFLGGFISEVEVKKDIGTQTGVLSLDLCLGGGIPSGIAEIFGEESTGKTGLIARIAARSQQLGKEVVLCASEVFDADYYERLGVRLEDMAVVKGPYEIVVPILVEAVAPPNRVVLVDSLTALRPMSDHIAAWNEITYEFLSHIQGRMGPGSVMVVTSQVRVRRSLQPGKFASGTTSASRWVNDCFTTRIEISRDEVHEDSYTMVADLVANTISRPGSWVTIPTTKGMGPDIGLDTVRTALRLGAIEKRGSVYYCGSLTLGRGEREASEVLRANRAALQAVMERVMEAAGL